MEISQEDAVLAGYAISTFLKIADVLRETSPEVPDVEHRADLERLQRQLLTSAAVPAYRQGPFRAKES